MAYIGKVQNQTTIASTSAPQDPESEDSWFILQTMMFPLIFFLAIEQGACFLIIKLFIISQDIVLQLVCN